MLTKGHALTFMQGISLLELGPVDEITPPIISSDESVAFGFKKRRDRSIHAKHSFNLTSGAASKEALLRSQQHIAKRFYYPHEAAMIHELQHGATRVGHASALVSHAFPKLTIAPAPPPRRVLW